MRIIKKDQITHHKWGGALFEVLSNEKQNSHFYLVFVFLIFYMLIEIKWSDAIGNIFIMKYLLNQKNGMILS